MARKTSVPNDAWSVGKASGQAFRVALSMWTVVEFVSEEMEFGRGNVLANLLEGVELFVV